MRFFKVIRKILKFFFKIAKFVIGFYIVLIMPFQIMKKLQHPPYTIHDVRPPEEYYSVDQLDAMNRREYELFQKYINSKITSIEILYDEDNKYYYREFKNLKIIKDLKDNVIKSTSIIRRHNFIIYFRIVITLNTENGPYSMEFQTNPYKYLTGQPKIKRYSRMLLYDYPFFSARDVFYSAEDPVKLLSSYKYANTTTLKWENFIFKQIDYYNPYFYTDFVVKYIDEIKKGEVHVQN